MAKKRRPARTPAWPYVRAALLCFFIAFNVFAAFPSPGNVTLSKINTKTNRAELMRWVKILDGWGIEVTPDALAQWYVDLAADFEGVKRVAVKPIEPWLHYTKTHQGWRLFGMPDERPFRLQVRIVEGGEEQVLYRTASDEHTWNAGLFQFRRIRGCYNPGNLYAPGTYPGFARRVSELAFEAYPDADEVVVSMLQGHTTLPSAPPDTTVEERYVQRFGRGTR